MRFAAILLSLAVVACVSTNVALLDTSVHYTPVCKEGVIFYSTRDKAPATYKEVALLNSKGASGWTNESQLVESMRNEAAKIGATGVILNDIKEPGTGEKVAAAVFGISAERKGKALAIFADADTARVRQACSPLAPKAAANDSGATSATPGNEESSCKAHDTFTQQGDQVHITVHEERAGQGCVEFRTCHYDATSVSTTEQAIARCRGEPKKEE
jgi:hypothetical protein